MCFNSWIKDNYFSYEKYFKLSAHCIMCPIPKVLRIIYTELWYKWILNWRYTNKKCSLMQELNYYTKLHPQYYVIFIQISIFSILKHCFIVSCIYFNKIGNSTKRFLPAKLPIGTQNSLNVVFAQNSWIRVIMVNVYEYILVLLKIKACDTKYVNNHCAYFNGPTHA